MRTIRAGEAGYEEARRGFAARFDHEPIRPRAVLFPATIPEVADAVRRADAGFSIRSGGHDYEGRSSRTSGDLIDLSQLKTFELDGDVATLGPGLTMGELNDRLASTGRTFPMATGATVGLGGYLLGGGLGLTSRRFGLASDSLLEATLVAPNGEVLIVDEKREPDLFWALRGGGNARFGAVVRFRVRLHPIGRVRLFRARWPWAQAAETIHRYSVLAPDLAPGITTALTIRADRTIEMVGVFAPESAADGKTLRDRLGALAPQTKSVGLAMPGAQRLAFGALPWASAWALATPMRRQIFAATSGFASTSLPPEACETVRAAIECVPKLEEQPSQLSMVRLLAGGGALARGPGCTALRSSRILLQYDAYWNHPQDERPTRDWLRSLRDGLSPWTDGAYAGYQDAELPESAYYGEDFPRLERVAADFRGRLC